MDYKSHIPVLLQQSIDALAIKPEGVYIDLTFGGGGHSQEILQQLSEKGKLIAFDQDQDSARVAEKIKQKNFFFIRSNFRFVYPFLKYHHIDSVDGVLADLGVSSHQLESPERGFSFLTAGNLDMRMDQNITKNAQDIVNTYTLEALTDILKCWGEVPRAYHIAQKIVQSRKKKIQTAEDLMQVLAPLAPAYKPYQFYAKIFQGLRIAVNEEMQSLQEMLQSMPYVIKPGGKLVVLSYHSLEDRMVKKFLNTGNGKGILQKDSLGNTIRPFFAQPKKAIKASPETIAQNKKSRSVRLRVGVKL